MRARNYLPDKICCLLDSLADMKVPLRHAQVTTLGRVLADDGLIDLSHAQAEQSKHWFCPSLFQVVSDLENLKRLLSAVLLEKQIICYGKSTHLVTGVILGLESLTRPFKWQVALIPILPKMLLDYLEAPIPMLAGITRAQFDQARQILSPEQMEERIWINADSGVITWTAFQAEIPDIVFGSLWERVAPLWSGLQHSIRKYQNQMMYLRSSQKPSLMAVANANGRCTPTGPPASHANEFGTRRGSGASTACTNRSADFTYFRTVRSAYNNSVTSHRQPPQQQYLNCASMANQNWVDLPSPEMRSQSVEICRIVSEQIHEHVIAGCLTEALLRSPLSFQEVEELQQQMVRDADPPDQAFIALFVNT